MSYRASREDTMYAYTAIAVRDAWSRRRCGGALPVMNLKQRFLARRPYARVPTILYGYYTKCVHISLPTVYSEDKHGPTSGKLGVAMVHESRANVRKYYAFTRSAIEQYGSRKNHRTS